MTRVRTTFKMRRNLLAVETIIDKVEAKIPASVTSNDRRLEMLQAADLVVKVTTLKRTLIRAIIMRQAVPVSKTINA